jgi:hypothetical protein
MKPPKDPPLFAVHWAEELGADPNGLERLQGGINNQVFRSSDGAQNWVIKGYSPAQPGQPDRMLAEQQFLLFANQMAPGFTPSLVCADHDRRCVVLEYVHGSTFGEDVPPCAEAVSEAVRFIHLLNRDPQRAREYIQLDAAEGFQSMSQHIANVRSRLDSMSCEHVKTEVKPLAEAMLQKVSTELCQVAEQTHRAIEQGVISDSISLDKRCVSPSDFGFHNAISTEEGIRFIDFEFAGWDDPAKTTLDFILQPRVPVVGFGSPLLSAWQQQERPSIQSRCQYLEPILRLKWLCILLSVLNPTRLQHILDVISMETRSQLVLRRLKSAEIYLARTQ